MMMIALVAAAWFVALGAAQQNASFTIHMRYPSTSAQQFGIRGEGAALPGGWNTELPLQRVSANLWRIKLAFPSTAANTSLTFKILCNGVWQVGANTVADLRAGGAFDTTPWFFTVSGNVAVLGSVSSNVLNNTRPIIAYTPPSYTENPLKPVKHVLVMHDGQNLFNDSTSFGGLSWRVQDTVDALINAGLMHDVLVVGVYNTAERTDEYTYSYDAGEGAGGNGNLYLDFLESTVLPFARSKLRIPSSGVSMGILGSSLGGLISCYAGWTRPHVWTRTGCMSSSFWWNNQDFNNTVLNGFPNPPQPRLLYIDTGDDEGSQPQTQVQQTSAVVQHVQGLAGWSLGTNLGYYIDQGGQHNEYFWGKRFHVPMTFLYGTGVANGEMRGRE